MKQAGDTFRDPGRVEPTAVTPKPLVIAEKLGPDSLLSSPTPIGFTDDVGDTRLWNLRDAYKKPRLHADSADDAEVVPAGRTDKTFCAGRAFAILRELSARRETVEGGRDERSYATGFATGSRCIDRARCIQQNRFGYVAVEGRFRAEQLWERKRQIIEHIARLEIWRVEKHLTILVAVKT